MAIMNVLPASTILILYFFLSSVSASGNYPKYLVYGYENATNTITIVDTQEERIKPDVPSLNNSRLDHSIAVLTASNETYTESQNKSSLNAAFLDSSTETNHDFDYSFFSQEFLNCSHVSIERHHFQELQNGSVYVPMYKKTFGKADHLIRNNLLFICHMKDDYSNETNDDPDYYSFLSEEFFNCTHVNLDRDHFQELQNGSVYVPMYNMVFDKADHLIRNNLLFICPVFYPKYEDHEKFSTSFSIVSNVCMGISAVCITLHMIMFCIVKRLRNLPGYILLSLCAALQSAYLCSFIQYEFYETVDCSTNGMFLLYFFLSSFFWMNAMSYDVWRSIRMATAKLRLTADRPIMVRFGRYSLYSWGVPLIIIVVSIIVHHTASEESRYRLIFNEVNCWFKYKQALNAYFAIPLFTLLSLNVLFFISSFYMITRATMSKSQSSTQNKSDLWSRLFLSLRLGTVMGFMWIFGIIAAVTNKEWLWYLYAACNALQGVFIFFSFTVSERTRKLCKKAFKGRKFSTMPTQVSTNSHAPTQQTTSM